MLPLKCVITKDSQSGRYLSLRVMEKSRGGEEKGGDRLLLEPNNFLLQYLYNKP